jgi:hypothetical protein
VIRLPLLALLAFAQLALAAPEIQVWSRSEEFRRSAPAQVDYLLGLGALQKVRGLWRHKHSETIAGDLQRVTWKVDPGYTAGEGFDWLQGQLPDGSELLFGCEGRQCGSSAQWASRVFEERELYGHDDRQRYAAWRYTDSDGTWTIVLYASDRANRRHFLHMDLLKHGLPTE